MSVKSTITCLKFSLLGLSLLFLQPASAQPGKKNPKEVGLTAYADVDETVVRNQKGFGNDVVALLWTDTLVYKHELGEFDARTSVPVGDASKWLTVAMVLKMVDQGKLSLDDKVGSYLPIFDTYGKSYITIRHCLTHFTGIQADGNGGLFGKKKWSSLEEEVNAYAKKEIRTNPGTEFSYSNIGINIAGRILEVVSKKKFDMLIKKELFNPLQMRKTTFSTLDASALNPAMGATSTGEEYLHFLQMLLNKGKYNGVQVLSEASVEELRKIQTQPELVKYSPRTTEGLSYALGSWVVTEGADGKAQTLSTGGISGTFPLVDWCRNYAFLLITKDVLSEQKKDAYVQLVEALNERIKPKCK
jgi:CubicO group peptidase (beta-lactamase class C family)